MNADTLNILWITERYPPLAGGMAVSAHRQVTTLRRRKHRVDVMAFRNRPGEKNVTFRRTLRDSGQDMQVAHSEDYGNAAQRGWREVMLCHHKTPYHLVIGFGACMPGYTAVTWGAFLGIPAMVSVRGSDFDRDWFEPKRGGFVRDALARADRIGAVSLEKSTKIKALFPEKNVFWCPNGVDPGLYDLLPDEQELCEKLRYELNSQGRRIIGLFGELKYKKRIPDLLSAIREQGLKDRVSLLITGCMDGECQALIDDPTLSPVSRHLSFRDADRLPALYAACDFVAIPSLFEGFPNVLLESMAAGAVPIVSDAGAMGDVIQQGKTGYIFPALDRKACGNILTQALSLTDDKLALMKQRVRQEVRNRYTVDRESRILEREILATVRMYNAYRHTDQPGRALP